MIKLPQLPVLIEKTRCLTRIALEMLRTQQDALSIISADEVLLSEIACNLAYKGRSWLFFTPGNDYYDRLLEEIRDVYPTLGSHPVLAYSPTHRWLLIVRENHVEPLIFKLVANRVSLYRVVWGKNIRWLPVLYDNLNNVREKANFMPNLDKSLPDYGLRLPSGNQLRDPKWDVGGLHLE